MSHYRHVLLYITISNVLSLNMVTLGHIFHLGEQPSTIRRRAVRVAPLVVSVTTWLSSKSRFRVAPLR